VNGPYNRFVELQTLLRALWRRKLVVAVVAIAVAVAGAAAILGRASTYQSSATVALLPSAKDGNSVTIYSQSIGSLLTTYAQLLKSETFLSQVAGDLPFHVSGRDLATHVSADPVANATVIKVKAQWPSAEDARRIATAVTNRFVDEVSRDGVVRAQVIDRPRTPDAALAPGPLLALVALIPVALALAAAAALAWDRLFGRLDDPRVLVDAVPDTSLAGVVPFAEELRGRPAIVRDVAGDASLIRSFRAIRTNVVHALAGMERPAVAVIGVRDSVGTTTVAANLAVTLASGGSRVVLVDADGEGPRQHLMFGLGPGTGGELVARETGYPGLRLVSAPDDPAAADRIAGSLAALRNDADIVVIDAPPLTSATGDARLVASQAGAALLVVGPRTPPDEVRKAVDALRMLDVRVVGTVITQVSPRVAATWANGYRPSLASDVVVAAGRP
jgi:polysaccharide biosynthesis transport protein